MYCDWSEDVFLVKLLVAGVNNGIMKESKGNMKRCLDITSAFEPSLLQQVVEDAPLWQL
jgi:hypothetical protein